MEYKPGKANAVADALSRKVDLAAISRPESSLLERIKEGLSHDPTAKTLIENAEEGKTRRFWVEGDLLYTKGHRLYVPQHGKLRKEIMQECHDSRWAGHLGMSSRYASYLGTLGGPLLLATHGR